MDEELKRQAPLHPAAPRHLPDRRAHRGAGRERHGPGRLHPELGARRGSSACTTALGGGLSRATVFALGIMPYISASIIFQLAGGVAPSIGKMQKDEEGKKKITQWTRYLTVFISLSQAYTFALFTESIPGRGAEPGFGSRLIMVRDPHHRRDLRDVAG